MNSFKTIEWKNDRVLMIDQRKLPIEEVYIECDSFLDVARCIKNLAIRGAPAIGIAAAMGMALGALSINDDCGYEEFKRRMKVISEHLTETRPTAVNLFWAIRRMEALISKSSDKKTREIKNVLVTEALEIQKEDLKTCVKIGATGSKLIKNDSVVLTHCNAGGLATSGYGTALGVIRSAFQQGKNISVISCETRPVLQGARLTAWELERDGIPVRLITDSMAGYLMAEGAVDSVVVGADRVALNGDTANKIGTYSLSILAKYHDIPFYVAVPTSTIDDNCSSGEDITIEYRDLEEITHMDGRRISAQVDAINPAFDITPSENIECFITEAGLLREPYAKSFKRIKTKNQ